MSRVASCRPIDHLELNPSPFANKLPRIFRQSRATGAANRRSYEKKT
jgi:hypothetical protein